MKLLKLVPDNTNIDFMGWRNVALVLSVLVTVASLVIVGVRGLNLGVDFVGGQMIRTTFTQPIDVDQLRGRVGALNLGDASIQESGGPTTYQIRLPKPEGGEAAANRAASQVRAMVERSYPGARVDAVETVSGKVSEELALDGALAITLAMLGIAIYIWFRFEWQFGVGALFSLFHDVIITLGFFALTQLEFDPDVEVPPDQHDSQTPRQLSPDRRHPVEEAPAQPRSGLALVVECESEAEATAIFGKLAQGGQVLMELQDTFWGAKYGKVKDKFGFVWDLNAEKVQ